MRALLIAAGCALVAGSACSSTADREVLCTGLAVFGLCMPVPGQPVSALEEAGWTNVSEEAGFWTSARLFGSGTLDLSVLVSGDSQVVETVFLKETSTNTAAESVVRALDRICPDGNRVCSHRGHLFWRMPCGAGWRLYAPSFHANRTAMEENCKRLPYSESPETR